jgi:hypothetical protein
MTLPDVPALELINQVDHQTVRAALALATRAPLSQPLKIGSTRRVLHEGVLDDTLSPQLVLRLGWPPVGPPLPVTPRRTYQEEER